MREAVLSSIFTLESPPGDLAMSPRLKQLPPFSTFEVLVPAICSLSPRGGMSSSLSDRVIGGGDCGLDTLPMEVAGVIEVMEVIEVTGIIEVVVRDFGRRWDSSVSGGRDCDESSSDWFDKFGGFACSGASRLPRNAYTYSPSAALQQ